MPHVTPAAPIRRDPQTVTACPRPTIRKGHRRGRGRKVHQAAPVSLRISVAPRPVRRLRQRRQQVRVRELAPEPVLHHRQPPGHHRRRERGPARHPGAARPRRAGLLVRPEISQGDAVARGPRCTTRPQDPSGSSTPPSPRPLPPRPLPPCSRVDATTSGVLSPFEKAPNRHTH